ncbi:hypothetical protein AKO1_015527 [Acrasis kona]|uniref:Uncharacterized protein n=1 Tax=Acrasis kona TaxID=1008807 RepID=A0AAW2YJJ4_9EUKA
MIVAPHPPADTNPKTNCSKKSEKEVNESTTDGSIDYITNWTTNTLLTLFTKDNIKNEPDAAIKVFRLLFTDDVVAHVVKESNYFAAYIGDPDIKMSTLSQREDHTKRRKISSSHYEPTAPSSDDQADEKDEELTELTTLENVITYEMWKSSNNHDNIPTIINTDLLWRYIRCCLSIGFTPVKLNDTESGWPQTLSSIMTSTQFHLVQKCINFDCE